MKLAFAFKIGKGGKVEVLTSTLPFLEAREQALKAAPKTPDANPVYLVKMGHARQVKPWVGTKSAASLKRLEEAEKLKAEVQAAEGKTAGKATK